MHIETQNNEQLKMAVGKTCSKTRTVLCRRRRFMSLTSQLPSQYRSLFAAVIQFTPQKDLQKGKSLHAQFIKAGTVSCVYIANAVVDLYAKCGELPGAHIVFDAIPDKDVVSWNSLINGYSQQGLRASSLVVVELFRRMRTENTFPNAHTFSGIFTAASNVSDVSCGLQVHALATKAASFYDVFVGSSLLNMYCKAGLVFDARKVFDRMLERNSGSGATMISGCAMQRMAGEALAVFGFMRGDVEKEEENEFFFDECS